MIEPRRETPEFFGIDLDKLDRDWVTHASTVYEFALQLADARDDRDRAKAALDIANDDLDRMAAEVELDVRRHPERFGIEKITEAVVKASVLICPKYRDAQEVVYTARRRVNKALHDVGILEAAIKALDHKRDGLEAAGRLFGMSYFAAPRVDRETHAAVADSSIDRAFKKRSRGERHDGG